MSTPNIVDLTKESRYTEGVVFKPKTTWSGLLKKQVLKCGRHKAFMEEGWAVKILSNKQKAIQMIPGDACVGDKLPFEIVYDKKSYVRVDVHHDERIKLTITLIAQGMESFNCSEGGTFKVAYGPIWIFAKGRRATSCILTYSSKVTVNDVAEFVNPGMTLMGVTVVPGTVALIQVTYNGRFVCPSCGYEGGLDDIARHFNRRRFIGFPRILTVNGLGEYYKKKVTQFHESNSWKGNFINQSKKIGNVAWHLLPAVTSTEVCNIMNIKL